MGGSGRPSSPNSPRHPRHTVMGKGVSFMEGKEEFHGRALNLEEYKKAIQELGVEDDLDRYRQIRDGETDSFPEGNIQGNLHPSRPEVQEIMEET